MSTRRSHWLELDLLRSIAALTMVLSHLAAHGEFAVDQPVIRVMSITGSFAPVLFFTLTGLGFGVQSIGRTPEGWGGPFLKTLILIAVDSLFWLRPGLYVGNDFLGFIGLSMLLLEAVRRMPHSGRIALGLATAAVLVRFVVGTALKSGFGLGTTPSSNGAMAVFQFLIAVRTEPSFPYHPAPWLFYPLFGYVLGRAAAVHREMVESRWRILLAGIAVGAILSGLVARVLVNRGMAFHRFGSISFAYFVMSLFVICVSFAMVLLLRRRSCVQTLSQRFPFSGFAAWHSCPFIMR